jgi:hypothetical protein
MKKRAKARKKFIPSEELSHLYMKAIRTPEEDERNKFLEIARYVIKESLSWDKLTEEVRTAFIKSTSERLHSIFIFFAQDLQKDGGRNKGDYSDNDGFSEENCPDIMYHFDLEDSENNDFTKKFIRKLYEEFVSFLTANKFESEMVKVYLEDKKIVVERLADFHPLDIEEILNSNKWTTF